MPERTHRGRFAELTQRYPMAPVTHTVRATGETPVSTYLKVAAGPWSFLLESVEGGTTWARYSLVGCAPFLSAECRDGVLRVESEGEVSVSSDPAEGLRRLVDDHRMPVLPGLPRLVGGLVGYFGSGCARLFERLPRPKADPLGLPDIRMFAPGVILAFDNVNGSLTIIAPAHGNGGRGGYDDAQDRIDWALERLARPLPPGAVSDGPHAPPDLRAAVERASFEHMVERGKEAVRAGEVVQVVLSRSLSAPTTVRPFSAYRALRTIDPSPYMFHLALGEETLVGASPEVMVRVEGDRALVRPIAGTRPRGATPDLDSALEAELLADEKERAEHVMLLDLGRNDLGRVAVPGGVSVDASFEVERYSHVMHLTSTVSAKLRPQVDALEVFAAAFPAGTVSGAPKVRALELIHELEPHARGPYSGAVGYLGFDGSLDTCIAIRTLVFHEGRVSLQTGAGIVADSDPGREFEETVHKGAALRRALALASRGSLPADDLRRSTVRPGSAVVAERMAS